MNEDLLRKEFERLAVCGRAFADQRKAEFIDRLKGMDATERASLLIRSGHVIMESIKEKSLFQVAPLTLERVLLWYAYLGACMVSEELDRKEGG